MPKGKEYNLPIHGSVIQRSIVPEGLGGVLNVATVPISEIDQSYLKNSDGSEFRSLVGQVLGIPCGSILDHNQYGILTNQFRDRRYWRDLAEEAPDPFLHDLFYRSYRYWVDFEIDSGKNVNSLDYDGNTAAMLGGHSIRLMVSPVTRTAPFSPFYPSVIFPRRRRRTRDPLGEIDITEEAMQIGASCFFSSIDPDERVIRFAEAVGSYDIPSGQSPATRADDLKKLIETSKKVCLAPLALGGTAAITQLSQGSYVTALLTTGTASAMTLVLVGTVSVADYLVHYLLHKRNSLVEGRNKEGSSEQGK